MFWRFNDVIVEIEFGNIVVELGIGFTLLTERSYIASFLRD
jgi:hypothetical protein